MNEFMQKIKYWSLDLITSGLPLDYDINILRKFIIINLLLVFGSGALFIFSIIALIQDYFILCVADATFFLILMWSLYILRKKKIYIFIGIFGTIVVGLFFLFFVAYIDVERSVYLWILTYPIVALFILGKKIGSYFSAIFLLLICIFFFFGGHFHILQSYDIDIITRLVGVYILLHLMALATEIVWENVHNKLVSEIINRNKVESQLSHAQKMEAIGVLAGGVAHDLNNILSSIVTYPDIIFLDLPDDSPD
jgi:signal transduction histidine kinase